MSQSGHFHHGMVGLGPGEVSFVYQGFFCFVLCVYVWGFFVCFCFVGFVCVFVLLCFFFLTDLYSNLVGSVSQCYMCCVCTCLICSCYVLKLHS